MMNKFQRYAWLLLVFLFVCNCGLLAQKKKKSKKDQASAELVVDTVSNANESSAKKEYKYVNVDGDPLKARIYTLDNGLKVYMTVYKEEPRVQTFIATKAGSKNDPTDATGLAHYLEHMLFKGTDKYGTLNYEKEKVYLEQIKELYEKRRSVEDTVKRKEIYHQIDSLSGMAAKLAIANEYDKMLSGIGARGTNAYTWLEQTVYVNDVPSNQLNKWLAIEAERFRKPVMRIFHTELEAVYEEKNRSLDNDASKTWEALFAGLWQKHTYGTQTTIGTIDHLKNPSIMEIQKYYDTYYVPNNMAIFLSGDFDPDEVILKVDEHFGNLKPKEIPSWTRVQEDPIEKPIIKEVLGPDAENLYLAFRFDGGSSSRDADMITMINQILYNGKAGLIDLNLNQGQKVLSAAAFDMTLREYSAHVFGGEAKEGQKLEEVRDLILEQIEKVKRGEFPDWMLSAIINNMKLSDIKQQESNYSRADAMLNSFVDEVPWEASVNRIERLSKITKEEIVEFAKKHYGNNYVIVYKRTGVDENVPKIMKPEITPVELNREAQSDFLKTIMSQETAEVEPAFLDYKQDIQSYTMPNGLEVFYTQNEENGLFELYYVLEMGRNHNKQLPIAINYLEFLGTSKYSASEIQQEFYKLGSSYSVFSSEEKVYVMLRGLADNFDSSLKLFEDLLNDPKPDKEALKNLVDDELKRRADRKLNKSTILWSALLPYGKYGPNSPATNILSETELRKLKPEELTGIIKTLNTYEHHILYYGPYGLKELSGILTKSHKVPELRKAPPKPVEFKELQSTNDVYVVDYDMKQAEVILLSRSELYNKDKLPVANLFNEYYGGGMGSVVFQEIRESKALAYSVFSAFTTPNYKDRHHYTLAYIGTQADKLPEAMDGMMEVINNMPESEALFNTAKEAVIQKLRTQRITKADKLFNYETARNLGHDYDLRKDVYENVPKFTLADLKKFHEEQMKGKNYTMLVIGKKGELDIKTLEKYGKVTYLSLEDIFGY